MAIWSLATLKQDEGVIDVSLYPTEHRAYEALTNIILGEDPDDPDKKDAFRSRLRKLATATDKMKVLDEVLSEIGLNVTVAQHHSPGPTTIRLDETAIRNKRLNRRYLANGPARSSRPRHNDSLD
jgi:hypothetical protein